MRRETSTRVKVQIEREETKRREEVEGATGGESVTYHWQSRHQATPKACEGAAATRLQSRYRGNTTRNQTLDAVRVEWLRYYMRADVAEPAAAMTLAVTRAEREEIEAMFGAQANASSLLGHPHVPPPQPVTSVSSAPPAPQSDVHVCHAGTCVAHGAEAVLTEIEELVNRIGGDTDCTVRQTGCLGFCNQAPSALVVVRGVRRLDPKYVHVRIHSLEDSAKVVQSATGRQPTLEGAIARGRPSSSDTGGGWGSGGGQSTSPASGCCQRCSSGYRSYGTEPLSAATTSLCTALALCLARCRPGSNAERKAERKAAVVLQSRYRSPTELQYLALALTLALSHPTP